MSDSPCAGPIERPAAPAAAAAAWFAACGWQPFPFQREVWRAMAGGDSGLLHASTGSGKTYAAWLGALARGAPGAGLQVLWLAPMRALAADTTGALRLPLPDLAPAWTVGILMADVLASLNSGQLAQRRFREIARVAGLVFGGYPGAPKSLRQLQASSSPFFAVFRKYDAGNRLLGQAEAEVLAQELELQRLRRTLEQLAALPIDGVDLKAPSPFALPLMVERLREQLSTEKLGDRLQRLLQEAEAALLEAPAGRRTRASSRARRPIPAAE